MHFAFILFATPAFATSTASSLTGRVLSQGRPAAGVTVTVTSKALQHERTTVTGPHGRYWLDSLPPGVYDVTFARTGLQTYTRRAVVELARVARADATIEPSEEGESVTSTATMMNVNETTAITTHFSDRTLDRLPIRRTPDQVMDIGPGGLPLPFAIVDNAQIYGSDAYGEESIEQVTLLRGALPVEYERFSTVPAARTRSGGEEFSLSLRDTVTEGIEHFLETASGGRIVRERLWFFASGWRGDANRGYVVKLTGQPGANHNLVLSWMDNDRPARSFSEGEESALSLSWTGVAGPHLLFDAVAARTEHAPLPGTLVDDALFARASYVAGNHVLTAGVRLTDIHDSVKTRALFVSDRWSREKLTLYLGVRHESGSAIDDRLTPRLAATYDIMGNGRHAIVASYSESSDPRDFGVFAETTLGYAALVGTSGSVRVDALRRTFQDETVNGAQLDFSYRLFDRLEAGANYAWLDFDAQGATFPEHTARGWLGVEVPLGEQVFGVTVLERFRSSTHPLFEEHFATDVALRYTVPFPRFALTLAADAADVFEDRSVRGWVRLRL